MRQAGRYIDAVDASVSVWWPAGARQARGGRRLGRRRARPLPAGVPRGLTVRHAAVLSWCSRSTAARQLAKRDLPAVSTRARGSSPAFLALDAELAAVLVITERPREHQLIADAHPQCFPVGHQAHAGLGIPRVLVTRHSRCSSGGGGGGWGGRPATASGAPNARSLVVPYTATGLRARCRITRGRSSPRC